MNWDRLKYRIEHYFGNYQYALWNSYIFSSDWESDYFCISKSGYMTEVEIKLSRSDFKADFKKVRKHEIMGSKKPIYTKPGGDYMHAYNPDTKKWDLPLASCIEVIQVSKCAPNKFTYACPDGLIEKHEVPNYAGLLWVNDSRVLQVKSSPFIHKEKRKPDFLIDKFYYLSLEQKREIESQNHAYKQLRSVIDNADKLDFDSVKYIHGIDLHELYRKLGGAIQGRKERQKEVECINERLNQVA